MHIFDEDADPPEAPEAADLEAVAAMLEEDPDHVYLRRRYGLLLFRRRRFREAAAQFSQWARLAPNDDEAFLFLSRTLLRLDMFDFARAAAEMASRSGTLSPAASRMLHLISVREATASGGPGSQAMFSSEPEADLDPEFVDRADELVEELVARRPLIAAAPASAGSIVPELSPEDSWTPQPVHETAVRDVYAKREAGPRAAAARVWQAFCTGVDAFLDFTTLIMCLIRRQVAIQSINRMVTLIMVGGKLVIIINFHSMFFYVTDRTFAGQIALEPAILASFMDWTVYQMLARRTGQHSGNKMYNRANNIKWVHLFVAESTFDLFRILIAAVVIFVFGHIFILHFFPAIITPVVAPNVPQICGMVLLACTFGMGMGLCVDAAERRWPIFSAVDHTVNWIIFITSGHYQSYVTTPQIAAPYFKWNPLLTITEYTRNGFDGTYPVGDLTVWFPIIVSVVMITFGLAVQARDRREGGFEDHEGSESGAGALAAA